MDFITQVDQTTPRTDAYKSTNVRSKSKQSIAPTPNNHSNYPDYDNCTQPNHQSPYPSPLTPLRTIARTFGARLGTFPHVPGAIMSFPIFS